MRFQPLHFGWAALPPQPKAVVVFIGGAFFGSFPTLFYRGVLKTLYEQSYAIVALPFRFTFRHWDIALSLTIYAKEFRDEVEALRTASAPRGVKPAQIPYLWIGHSLGCKYVALLELLSESEELSKLDAIICALEQVATRQARELQAKLKLIAADQISLRNQPQVLVDPVIANADAAIPFKPLEALFSPLLKVAPSREETFRLIEKTGLFSLTSILSLASRTATDTICTLVSLPRPKGLKPVESTPVDLTNPKPLLGRHLSILGCTSTDPGISAAISQELEQLYPVAVAYQQGNHADSDENGNMDPGQALCD